MKKILLLISVFLMLGLASCNEQSEAKQSLQEEIEERIDNSVYSVRTGTLNLNEYLNSQQLYEQYTPVECVIVCRKNLIYAEDIWIYSFENGKDASELKSHLVSHSISDDLKYAACDNLLFLTKEQDWKLRYLEKIFSLEFEVGKTIVKKLEIELFISKYSSYYILFIFSNK